MLHVGILRTTALKTYLLALKNPTIETYYVQVYIGFHCGRSKVDRLSLLLLKINR